MTVPKREADNRASDNPRINRHQAARSWVHDLSILKSHRPVRVSRFMRRSLWSQDGGLGSKLGPIGGS